MFIYTTCEVFGFCHACFFPPDLNRAFNFVPSGSNNRLNEANNNRNNANRLFDSQNNDRGGYNVGDDFAAVFVFMKIYALMFDVSF